MRSSRLLMVEFFARGGLMHYAWQLAGALARHRLELTLLTARDPEVGGDAQVHLLPRLATWNPHAPPRRLPRRLRRAWRGLTYLRCWIQIYRCTRRLRPDWVLFGDLEHRCDSWGIAALRRLPVRLAVVWHNVEVFDREPNAQLTRSPGWRRRLVRRFDAVFVHGEALAAELRHQTGVVATPIPHGNQEWIAAQAGPDPGLRARLDLPPARTVALLFGTLNKYKGVPVLLQALALLPPGARPLVVIAGMPVAGVNLAAWQDEARASGIAADLRWVPGYIPTPETAWYFRLADLVVLPYLAASQSGVAHLALTFGKPLLVTRCGGLPEIMAGNGWIVEPGDPAALAAALAAASANPARLRQFGERSRELAVTRHAWPAIAARLAEKLTPAAVPAPPGEPAAASNPVFGPRTSRGRHRI